jgi:hypothetical protein
MTRLRAASPASLPAPSVLACSFRILLVKLQLRLLGFDRTWAIVRRRAEPRRDGASVPALEDLAPSPQLGHEAVEYRVALASALYPGRALCLERSLVLYHYLRRARVPVQFRLGVQPYPFAAHAWVERDGVPINDVPEHVAYFTPVDAAVGSPNERGTR